MVVETLSVGGLCENIWYEKRVQKVKSLEKPTQGTWEGNEK